MIETLLQAFVAAVLLVVVAPVLVRVAWDMDMRKRGFWWHTVGKKRRK